ncbi:ArgE/DapE family deacylase [Lactiplantibacillus plantarum]|uniref:ArgE/DapE family deacylase n=1 Tax=Lactiplantibacillus plantarum TaxID=1590 RepID=UPI0015A212F1|nr:ArgE/DapE family deacylase [Lactiplantibacillus plantarum]MBX4154029.1 ArgE/DapE family deacylase [Lactiplantibacillus plantarum]MED7643178.1 M20/M25/M40 family metallo-hydrolase [Lactiplantibacillus plantarum]NVO63821.1 ArgE/DapE family deacylase [Lactiplantibacillus plantarum]QOF01051.1 ArgE/DapE family deacylase [Lactiplantibacillus plantarum]UVO56775.1 ArgE/DapE family deacylase [Lactiplantibacillus plantarum]
MNGMAETAQLEAAVQALSDIVKMNTVNNHEQLVADYLVTLLKQHGIEAQSIEYAPGRVNLVAEIGDGHGPVVALDGHEDTVALGDADKWHTDPLAATIKDNRLYGRGVTDMKAGLMAEVFAMIALHDQDAPLHGTVRLLATVGEEVDHLGAEQLTELGYADDIQTLICAEPSGADKQLLLTKSIQAMLGVDGDTAQRMAAHSSMPAIGQNAIDMLMTYYQKQTAYFDSFKTIVNPVLGPTVPVVTLISGGEQVNTVPASAEMSVKIRTIPELRNDRLIKDLEAIIAECNADGANLTMDIASSFYPVHTPEDSQLVQLAKKVGEQVLQQRLPYFGAPGGTDASSYIVKSPDMQVIVFGPGNITAHQVNEYVDLDMYGRFIEIYQKMITELLA